jgi:hypothetical protein
MIKKASLLLSFINKCLILIWNQLAYFEPEYNSVNNAKRCLAQIFNALDDKYMPVEASILHHDMLPTLNGAIKGVDIRRNTHTYKLQLKHITMILSNFFLP